MSRRYNLSRDIVAINRGYEAGGLDSLLSAFREFIIMSACIVSHLDPILLNCFP
jgi:hypothetical protein